MFFLAWWFFGNLYEEIVLAPNQLVHTYEKLTCWQSYFSLTNQIYYYVPFTQIAAFMVCFLFWKSEPGELKIMLKKASVFGILAIVLTVVIVTELNAKLFFGDLEQHRDSLTSMAVMWMIANALRLYLVGSALLYVLRSYIVFEKLQRS